VFDRPRYVWLPKGEPFSGPRFEPARIEHIVIHYIGTAKAPKDSGRWMLQTHRDTMSRTPGYSHMYNAHVGLDGTTWEGRGVEYRNAANGSKTNPTTWSIVIGVDGQNPANPNQIAGTRKLIQAVRQHLGRNIGIIPHRQIGATQCPGEGITAQIAAGVFERNDNVIRIAGANRYETAVAVSQHSYANGAKVAYVVSGLNYPDALAAAPLAVNGPLLLTHPDRLPPEVAAEIRRLKVSRVVIVGGPSAVSEAVEAELKRLVP
jgi:hypothetical protein